MGFASRAPGRRSRIDKEPQKAKPASRRLLRRNGAGLLRCLPGPVPSWRFAVEPNTLNGVNVCLQRPLQHQHLFNVAKAPCGEHRRLSVRLENAFFWNPPEYQVECAVGSIALMVVALQTHSVGDDEDLNNALMRGVLQVTIWGSLWDKVLGLLVRESGSVCTPGSAAALENAFVASKASAQTYSQPGRAPVS